MENYATVTPFMNFFQRKERAEAGHIALGQKGERIAASYLRLHGYRIIARNVRTLRGEIDLIAERFGTVVFVEVKARAKSDGFEPSERVDHFKIERLQRAAEVWLEKHRENAPARLDVIGVCEGKVVEHWEDVGADFPK